MTPLNNKILRDLWRIKGQALAIALVIASGVAMYIMSLGTLYSLEETRDTYYERYRFADVFAPLKRAPHQLKDAVAEIPGVKTVTTRIIKTVTLDIPGFAEPATGQLISLPDNSEQILNLLHLRQGRLLSAHNPDEVLVSEAFATAHGFKPGSTFSAILNGHKRTLNIAGIVLSPEYIYALGPGALMPDDLRFGIIWMGQKAIEAAFDLGGSFTEVSMTIERNAQIEKIIATLDQLTEPYGGIQAYARKEQISNWFITNELDQLRAMGNFAPPLFLGVAAFLLHIVVSRLVKTEREQIGLLKAFGYSNASVAWVYIKLILAVVFVGLIIGIAGGTWLGRNMTEIYTDYFRFPFLYYIVDASIYIKAIMISVIVALLGTWASVMGAARLTPAVAMTPPPPTSYRTAWVEKILRMKTLSEPNRMILRHALRWPVRSGLNILGTALAVSIFISTAFFLDSMDYLIDLQFFQIQRQDITVNYTDARGGGAIEGIVGMPGVLMAEPVRMVPVRLISGHHKHNEVITGIASDAQITRLLGTDHKPLIIPSEGLALSTKLARDMEVKPGDLVRVEVKEGRRPIFHIPVTALVEEYIGTPVYMDMGALHKLLDEAPDVATGANLLIDPANAEELYRQFKGVPSIASAAIMGVVLDNFRKTIEENMGLMVTFNMAFAGIIAFSVVYNSARISLSERSRELASLRVLGFTRAEAAYILLGELALLILPALPLGCVLGYAQATLWVGSLDTDLFRMPFVIGRATYASSIVIVIIAAIVSGLIVRRKLDAMDLVGALKTRE